MRHKTKGIPTLAWPAIHSPFHCYRTYWTSEEAAELLKMPQINISLTAHPATLSNVTRRHLWWSGCTLVLWLVVTFVQRCPEDVSAGQQEEEKLRWPAIHSPFKQSRCTEPITRDNGAVMGDSLNWHTFYESSNGHSYSTTHHFGWSGWGSVVFLTGCYSYPVVSREHCCWIPGKT